MVEAFKTNVQKKIQSKLLLSVLKEAFPACKINFDLSDCDRVLRVEGNIIDAPGILGLMRENGVIDILLSKQASCLLCAG